MIGPNIVTRNEHQARGTIVVSVVMVGSARIEHVPFTARPFNHSSIKMKKILELKVPVVLKALPPSYYIVFEDRFLLRRLPSLSLVQLLSTPSQTFPFPFFYSPLLHHVRKIHPSCSRGCLPSASVRPCPYRARYRRYWCRRTL